MRRIFLDLDKMPRETKLVLAADESTPREVLSMLSKEDDDEILARLAGNTNTDFKIMYRLAYLEKPIINKGLASNPNVPSMILTTMYEHEGKNAPLLEMIDNPKTHGSLLLDIAKIEDYASKVAYSKNASSELLDYLVSAYPHDEGVICGVCCNSRASYKTLLKIYEKSEIDSLDFLNLASNETFIKGFFKDYVEEGFDLENASKDDIKLSASKNPNLDEKAQLVLISGFLELDIKNNIARNTKSTLVLERLLPIPGCGIEVASNPNVSYDALCLLMARAEHRMRYYANIEKLKEAVLNSPAIKSKWMRFKLKHGLYSY